MRRLGLVLDQILFAHQGGFSTDEVFIRFVEEVARGRFQEIDFCSRVLEADRTRPYPLASPPFRIRPVPWYRDIPSLCLRSPWLLPRAGAILRGAMDGWSLALGIGIHPLSLLALRQARRRGIPAALWLRGDLGRDLAHRVRGLRGAAAQAAYRLLVAALPRGIPVVSMGRDDYPFLPRLGPLHVAYSSKFGEEDLVPLPRPPRVPGAPLRLLYVGRLAPEKGVEVLLEAVERLQAGLRPPPRLTLVGDDYHGSRYGEAFRGTIAASPAASLVTLAGHIPFGPRLLASYDHHDVLVLPSFTEGFPQVVLEAMARGVPVVATRVGGVPRLVRHEEEGLLVPPGDARALSAALARLASQEGLGPELARRAQAVVAPYTRQRQVERVAAFLERVMEEGPGSPRA